MGTGLQGALQFLAYNIHETASHIIRGVHFGSYILQKRGGQYYCLHATFRMTIALQLAAQGTRH